MAGQNAFGHLHKVPVGARRYAERWFIIRRGQDAMAEYHLDAKLAREIVARTMKIIDSNINVMDNRGRILGSGDPERLGELHEGALLLLSPALMEWAHRLGIDPNQPRVAAVVEVDSGQLGVDSAMAELQQLQKLLTLPERDNLIAIVSLSEMVVLKPALNSHGRWDAEAHRRRVENLLVRINESSRLRVRIALGNYFIGPGNFVRSYRTARTTMAVGKQRMPERWAYYYQDLMLPVLLGSLRSGWQADELAWPLERLKAMDGNGLLLRTLNAWFLNNVQPTATAKALYIHRNTLEDRLNRISELTGLNLANFDARLLLYVGLQLDED